MSNKEYRLLLHIGLHKTATSSFQHNLCMQLHTDGVINFGGVRRGRDVPQIFYPCKKYIRQSYLEREINTITLETSRNELRGILVKDKLNVISEENLISRHIQDLRITFKNLKKMFDFCEIKILISLRNPVDRFFSLYVEDYPYMSRYDNEKKSTFKKYAEYFLENSHLEEFNSFNYPKLLNMIDGCFQNKKVMLYEDLLNDKKAYFENIAILLGITTDFALKNFEKKIRNQKKENESGKFNHTVRGGYFLRKRILEFDFIYQLNRKYGTDNLKYILRKILDFIPYKTRPILHQYPTGDLYRNLQQALSIKDLREFSGKHGLNENKLLKYGYGQ